MCQHYINLQTFFLKFEVPAGGLSALKGDYLGWHDPTPVSQAAIPYTPDKGQRVCWGSQLPVPKLDEALLDVHDPNKGILEMDRRQYALQVCYGMLMFLTLPLQGWQIVSFSYKFCENLYLWIHIE